MEINYLQLKETILGFHEIIIVIIIIIVIVLLNAGLIESSAKSFALPETSGR